MLLENKNKLKLIANTLEEFFGKQKLSIKPPLDTIIAIILTQSTNDIIALAAFNKLKAISSNLNNFPDISLEDLEEIIKISGLKKQKAISIKSVLTVIKQNELFFEQLKELEFKNAVKKLTLLKGVGLKTATCTLMFGLGFDLCPVDTHVNRVLCRLGFVPSNSHPDKTFYRIMDLIPKNKGFSLHTNLISIGRNYCRPQNPACYECPIKNQCNFKEKNMDITIKTNKVKSIFIVEYI